MRKYQFGGFRGVTGSKTPVFEWRNDSGDGRRAGRARREVRIQTSRRIARQNFPDERPGKRNRMRRNALHRYAVEKMANGAGSFRGDRTMLVNDLRRNRRGEERANGDKDKRREQ